MPVPTISQVRPGSLVSIVLKQDQPTGRQVQGAVQDVLTSGNHPRGIKVRLSDGRIGRVQRMATGQSGTRAEKEQDLRTQDAARGNGHEQYTSYRLNSRYTDVRLDDAMEEPPAELDLMAFVKEKKPKGKKKSATAKASDMAATISACPICQTFQGDEAAVAHHVEQHFAGSEHA